MKIETFPFAKITADMMEEMPTDDVAKLKRTGQTHWISYLHANVYVPVTSPKAGGRPKTDDYSWHQRALFDRILKRVDLAQQLTENQKQDLRELNLTVRDLLALDYVSPKTK